MYKKLYPNKSFKSIYDIDYKSYYNEGFRVIFFDLDNTLVSYNTKEADYRLKLFYRMLLGIGFDVYIVSNGSSKRVNLFSLSLYDIPFLAKAKKPLKSKVKKFIKKNNILTNEVLYIGDQLMTDVYLANKLKIYSIIVDPLEKSFEYLRTKINRKLESHFLKKLRKKDLDKFISIFGEDFEV